MKISSVLTSNRRAKNYLPYILIYLKCQNPLLGKPGIQVAEQDLKQPPLVNLPESRDSDQDIFFSSTVRVHVYMYLGIYTSTPNYNFYTSVCYLFLSDVDD